MSFSKLFSTDTITNLITKWNGNADSFDSHLAENANKAHGGFKGALLFKTVTQSIPNDVDTFIVFQSANYDTDNFYNSSNPERLTIPNGISKIRLTANSSFTTFGAGRHILNFYKNGASMNGSGRVDLNANVLSMNLKSAVVNVIEGDYFAVNIRQATGGSRNIPNSNPDVFFLLEVIE